MQGGFVRDNSTFPSEEYKEGGFVRDGSTFPSSEYKDGGAEDDFDFDYDELENEDKNNTGSDGQSGGFLRGLSVLPQKFYEL